MQPTLLFSLQIDCESTQRGIKNPELGERAIRGLQDVLASTGTLGTFLVLPGDLEIHARIYRELETLGHEIGLHVHPVEQGYGEFLGVHSPADQHAILSEGVDRFAQVMGRKPVSFCPGYGSANDNTAGILEQLGFTHGMLSFPTRDLPQCASVWGSCSLDPRYPHRYHRTLSGDVDFVDLPPTLDPESRMFGGKHPLDLRVELVDAKNHWYTINKSVRRQVAEKVPVPQIHALTHSVFDYSDPQNFRRETFVGIVNATREISAREGFAFRAAKMADVAEAYRRAVPLQRVGFDALKLDPNSMAGRVARA